MTPVLVLMLAAPAADPPRFAVTTRKAGDAVAVTGDAAETVFTVSSPSGIGRAVIERRGENWPKAVVLRLQLKGLEDLALTNGTTRIGAAVSVRDGKAEVRPWAGKDRAEAGAKDLLRLTARVVAEGGAAIGIPLKDGYFEVPVPPGFFADNPASVTVEWIDFYR